ncbi:hypothetical protein WJX81_007361 [Elliptochloris bilobata]|uniref:Activator of Hsp90 ATPase AHSA1-like N-terminal domain-containing protein n=1 Tax=Elliptochloris bilobata TaxID=381761 RepID=A0AAW1QJJ4_9CHLO
MAKVGEGDARWIVEDRADGTNVNAWHWEERDVLPWAKRRLQDLLGDLELLKSEGLDGVALRTSPTVEVSGEALTNNRKGKLIPSYELTVKGRWSGEARAGDGQAARGEGSWQIPYLADENADEDPELRVTAASDAALQRLRDAFLAHAKPAVFGAVRTFVKEMQAGGPAAKAQAAQAAKPADAAVRAAVAQAEAESRAQLEAAKKAAAKREAAEAAAGTASIELTERFVARPADLLTCFTEAHRVVAFTQAPAQVDPRVGGRFEILGGAVRATFTELSPQRIALDWHFSSWREGVVSKVVITLEEPTEGSTLLKLSHSGIPREDKFGGDAVETTRSGWRQQILYRVRAVFGYGL